MLSAPDPLFDESKATDVPRGTGTKWTNHRLARLGFLIGLGWDAAQISHDPIVHASEGSVYRKAGLLGLSFREARYQSKRLPRSSMAPFEAAAEKRAMLPDVLIRQLLLVIAREPALIDNILDDDGA